MRFCILERGWFVGTLHRDQENRVWSLNLNDVKAKGVSLHATTLDTMFETSKPEFHVPFFSSFMIGVTARSFVEWLSLFQQVSLSFTCPVYCGPSHVPWLLAGFSFGFLTCVCLTVALVVLLHRPILLWLVPPGPAPGAVPPARSLARLCGYLHGHSSWLGSCGFSAGYPGSLSSSGLPCFPSGSSWNCPWKSVLSLVGLFWQRSVPPVESGIYGDRLIQVEDGPPEIPQRLVDYGLYLDCWERFFLSGSSCLGRWFLVWCGSSHSDTLPAPRYDLSPRHSLGHLPCSWNFSSLLGSISWRKWHISSTCLDPPLTRILPSQLLLDLLRSLSWICSVLVGTFTDLPAINGEICDLVCRSRWTWTFDCQCAGWIQCFVARNGLLCHPSFVKEWWHVDLCSSRCFLRRCSHRLPFWRGCLTCHRSFKRGLRATSWGKRGGWRSCLFLVPLMWCWWMFLTMLWPGWEIMMPLVMDLMQSRRSHPSTLLPSRLHLSWYPLHRSGWVVMDQIG